MNQEESEQNEVDGVKKGADSTVECCGKDRQAGKPYKHDISSNRCACVY